MDMTLPTQTETRRDYLMIAEYVDPGSRVLDVGCGDGGLLRLLAEAKGVDGRGIELSQRGVNDCVAKGLPVIQGDADRDLATYPDLSFDAVILSQTIQATRDPLNVLREMLRIGRRGIVSFPNFGHWRVRTQYLLSGRMPSTRTLAYSWYETPNIHLCTILDFYDLCRVAGARVERALTLDAGGRAIGENWPRGALNLLGEQAIFVLTREDGTGERSIGERVRGMMKAGQGNRSADRVDAG